MRPGSVATASVLAVEAPAARTFGMVVVPLAVKTVAAVTSSHLAGCAIRTAQERHAYYSRPWDGRPVRLKSRLIYAGPDVAGVSKEDWNLSHVRAETDSACIVRGEHPNRSAEGGPDMDTSS